MGLKLSTLKKATKLAFDAAGEVSSYVLFRRKTSTYDPASGVNVVVAEDTLVEKTIATKYRAFESDKQYILSTDIKLFIPTYGFSLEPSVVTDVVVLTGYMYSNYWQAGYITADKEFNIVDVAKDPSGSVWILQLRAPS
jgi:hypothetical protein